MMTVKNINHMDENFTYLAIFFKFSWYLINVEDRWEPDSKLQTTSEELMQMPHHSLQIPHSIFQVSVYMRSLPPQF